MSQVIFEGNFFRKYEDGRIMFLYPKYDEDNDFDGYLEVEASKHELRRLKFLFGEEALPIDRSIMQQVEPLTYGDLKIGDVYTYHDDTSLRLKRKESRSIENKPVIFIKHLREDLIE